MRFQITGEASLTDIHCPTCGEVYHLAAQMQAGDTPLARMGRFELIERLGAGSFGMVWRACDVKLGRDVAVRVPLRNRLEPLEIEEFIREARFAARLNHPSIVTIHEVGSDDECVFIVSDLIDVVPGRRGVKSRIRPSERRFDFRHVLRMDRFSTDPTLCSESPLLLSYASVGACSGAEKSWDRNLRLRPSFQRWVAPI